MRGASACVVIESGTTGIRDSESKPLLHMGQDDKAVEDHAGKLCAVQLRARLGGDFVAGILNKHMAFAKRMAQRAVAAKSMQARLIRLIR